MTSILNLNAGMEKCSESNRLNYGLGGLSCRFNYGCDVTKPIELRFEMIKWPIKLRLVIIVTD